VHAVSVQGGSGSHRRALASCLVQALTRSRIGTIGAVALAPDGIYLQQAHIPSPRVSFEHMIRFMIEQLGVTRHREDWSKLLERTEAVFESYMTW
jgi:hypothetical protein